MLKTMATLSSNRISGKSVPYWVKVEIRAMLGEYFQVYFIRMLIITFNYVFYVNIVFK